MNNYYILIWIFSPLLEHYVHFPPKATGHSDIFLGCLIEFTGKHLVINAVY